MFEIMLPSIIVSDRDSQVIRKGEDRLRISSRLLSVYNINMHGDQIRKINEWYCTVLYLYPHTAHVKFQFDLGAGACSMRSVGMNSWCDHMSLCVE